jgi:uncharacterized protein YeaO (DUF488 family)
MTCEIHTARISYAGTDKLDVTRASAGPEGIAFAPSKRLLAAGKDGLPFEEYAKRYRDEMRALWIERRFVFEALLRRPRVVLVCYCTDPELCHRTLLAGFLAAAGTRLGVEVALRGEIGLEAAVVACVQARETTGKLTPRDILIAIRDAGAERCVVMAVLGRREIIPGGTYDRYRKDFAMAAKEMEVASP